MGTFGGHALPGSFFIVFSLWWTIQIYRRYYRSLRVNGAAPFRSSATFPFDCLCGRMRNLEWEGILKVFFTTVGFTLEIITAFHDGHFAYLGNGQHATMFFMFGLSGVIDIIVHHHPNLLPQSVEYLIAILAFTVEGILFAFHTHGRTPIDVLIHTLLLYAIMLCVIVSLIELRYRRNVLIPLARSYAVLLQGTWFWQAGFILYNPNTHAIKWKDDSHEEMMVVAMMFAWHMASAFVIILCIGIVVRLIEHCCCKGSEVMAYSNGGRTYDQVKLISSRRVDDVNENHDSVVNFEDSGDSLGEEEDAMFERVDAVLKGERT